MLSLKIFELCIQLPKIRLVLYIKKNVLNSYKSKFQD